jgi:hypothetical protein
MAGMSLSTHSSTIPANFERVHRVGETKNLFEVIRRGLTGGGLAKKKPVDEVSLLSVADIVQL